jgi:flavin-dependent dehydrogenase
LRYGWRDSWIKWQTDLWKNNSKIPIASAVAEWMYKLFDDNFEDIKIVPEIKKRFNWSVMYESSQATVDEFKKIGYNYSIEEHDKWLQSQTEILGYWTKIKNSVEEPLSLDDDVHKGIALALHGKKYDLLRQQVESKFFLLP